MKLCKKCSNPIPYRVWIKGKLRITNKRTYCLKCSPFGSKSTGRIHLEMGTSGDRNCKCTVCGDDYTYSRTKCNSTVVCSACTQKRRRRETKEFGIQLKGGKCQMCGYNRCNSNLTFHHLDPKKKEFGISSTTVSKNRMIKEIEKCILVCKNCHGEIEEGITKI